MTVVSFYTPTQDYAAHGARLRAECEGLGVPCVIEERPSVGGWLENTCQKPVFLREVRARIRGPMLWTDVDGSLVRRPPMLPDDVDFMARQWPAKSWRTWRVDTLYFADTEAVRLLLALWVEALVDHSDDYALNRMWATGAWTGRAAPLPPEYEPGARRPVIHYRRAKHAAKRADQRRLRARRAP